MDWSLTMDGDQIHLGKLSKVDLRKAWKNEALDFTSWLALDENLQLLGDAIGIDLKLQKTEAGVGKFSVDILAEEENTGKVIIIENQLEITNHDHLGKLITYASGYDAKIVIWIVADIREEHERAVDWLNEHSDEEISYFVVKVELWQIGDSLYAPKFQVISKPNDWAKTVKKSATESNLTEAKLLQLNYWDKFKEYADRKSTKLRLRNTSPQHWYDISLGSSEAHITLTLNTRENIITCEIYISDSKQLFVELKKFKEDIEKELDTKLNWQELIGKKASRIKLAREAEIDNTEKWNEYFEWMIINAEKFHRVFSKYIKRIGN